MALLFFHREFLSVLQLLRGVCRERGELAIDVVVLRHEVAVLRRQVSRPAPGPPGQVLLARLARALSKSRRGGFFVQPATL